MRRLAGLVILITAASAASVFAQTPSRGYIEAGVSEQITAHDITTSQTLPLYAETATISGTVGVPATPRFDFGGGVRVAGPLRVGALVSLLSHEGTATATFTLPDPFLFDTSHTGSGSAPAKRRELALHIQLSVPVVDSNGWQVIIAGGPTFAQIDQQLLTQAVTYSFVFPFDTITTGAGTASSTGHGFGGHVQASVVRAIAKQVGVYGDVLFSSAKVTVTGDAGSQKIDSGGLAFGGGIRIGF